MPLTETFRKYKLYHLLFWTLFFAGWYFLRYQDYSSQWLAFKITAVKVFDLAVMVYITNLLLIPRLLYQKKYALFTLIYVVMIFTSSVLKITIIGDILNIRNFSVWDNFKTRLYDNIIPHYLLVSTGAALKLLLDYGRAQKRLAEISKERAEAELRFLKSQINPHFLFNSLNSVYFLIDKSNREAREALHKFSEMLRYQLYECSGEKIGIEKELMYLQDYVDLQRLRKDDQYQVNYNCAQDVKGFVIEPLLLIPFVENSFKHLSHFGSGKINQVNIDVSRSNGEFFFTVANTVDYSSKGSTEPVGGIGLKNVRRRLELLYPGKHQLNISEDEGWFRVKLSLQVNKVPTSQL
ncbi:MAG TPA: histidine kinase [Chitinophagaceae bacterium]|nr:histidine kinase [Chitinophagaceae bacterium]